MNPSASGRSPDAEPPVVAEGEDRDPQLRGYDANVFAAWFVIDDAAVERAAVMHASLDDVQVGWDGESDTYAVFSGGVLAASGFESVDAASKGCHAFIARSILGAAGEEGERA